MMRVLAVAFIACSLGACVFAQCRVPAYLQGGTLYDSKSEIITNISIDFQDFTPDRLACLASSLKERYRGRNSITVSIFSSYQAAMNSTGLLPPEPRKIDYEMFARLHAYYLYDAEKHDDYVVLMPDPMIGDPSAPTNRKIDLAESIIPACKLQVNNRCLLKLDHFRIDPGEKQPGTVTLTAEIGRSGSVSDVQVVDTDKNGSRAQQAFADFALQNLKSWRFESSQNTDDMRIVYTLDRVETPIEHGINVQFILPDRVNIQVGPMSMTR
jgi:hypothetical protein